MGVRKNTQSSVLLILNIFVVAAVQKASVPYKHKIHKIIRS